jgi:Tfp pilus assembly protein PilF
LLPVLLARTPWAAPQQVTYHKDIEPILLQHCAPCHRLGEPGPFPLLTYSDARKNANRINAVTRRRYMPPWLPQPGYGEFAEERRLSDAQIDLIAKWVEAGAPEGKASDAPPHPAFTPGWELGTPDLVIRATKLLQIPAEGPDLFWNFILSPVVSAAHYVKAVEIRPGDARSVHHANVMIDRARTLRQQEKSPGDGFAGMDIAIPSDTFDPDSHFLFWKPGAAPWVEPDGLAWRLDPGNDLLLNVHFHPTGKAELAQPTIGLYFTDKPQTRFPMLLQLEHDGALDIPPGVRDFAVSDDFQLPAGVDVLGIYPHAHYLGKLLEGYATLPDGSRQWLIRIPEWDPNWQGVFRYRMPLFLPKGTIISMRYHYDNSAANPRNPSSPPKRVKAGNQSTDEMAHLWLQVLPRGAGDQRVPLQEALMLHRLEKYPADYSANFNLGALMLKRQDTASAIRYLRDALKAEPEQASALNGLGAALDLSGKRDEAVQQFQHALRIQPGYSGARYNLANALAAQGHLEEAAANYRQVLSAAPQDLKAKERLVTVIRELGDRAASEGHLDAALESYRELVSLEPDNSDLRNNFGILLVRTGAVAAAMKEFEAALKTNPAHQAARRNLELARKRLGQK